MTRETSNAIRDLANTLGELTNVAELGIHAGSMPQLEGVCRVVAKGMAAVNEKLYRLADGSDEDMDEKIVPLVAAKVVRRKRKGGRR